MKFLYLCCLTVSSFLLFGCAKTELVSVQPTTHTQNIRNIGQGKTVELQVIDGRENVKIEHVANPLITVDITDNSSNTVEAIYEATEKGLLAAGFKVVNQASSRHQNRVFIVTLKQINYQVISSPVVTINSLLSVKVVNDGVVYQHEYRADWNRPFFSNMTTSDDTAINTVLSDNINKIFFDRKLMAFLAGR